MANSVSHQCRLGLLADQVADASSGLAVDNVFGQGHAPHNGIDCLFMTLDYSRMVSVIIPAVSLCAARVQKLGQH